MLWGAMTTFSRVRWFVLAGLLVLTVSGCAGRGWREYVGLPAQRDPSVSLKATEPKWLLIKNPRCCDVASEPEYIWVEEDKVPTTMKSFVFGQSTRPSILSMSTLLDGITWSRNDFTASGFFFRNSLVTTWKITE